MNHDQTLKALESLASDSGILVRYEKGDFEGGFCVLKQERIIVINRKIAVQRKASILAAGLAEIGVTEEMLTPELRQFIEDELARQEKG